MILYKVLAYVGGILGLLKYGFTFGIFVYISYLMPESRQLAVLIGSSDSMSFLMGLGFWSAIVGIAVSIIVIVTVKKVSFIKKKLSAILILMGGIFFVVSWIAFQFMSGIVDDVVATSSTNFWSAIAIAGHDADKVYEGMNQQFLIEIIPSILLISSGLLAFRIYRKPSSVKL